MRPRSSPGPIEFLRVPLCLMCAGLYPHVSFSESTVSLKWHGTSDGACPLHSRHRSRLACCTRQHVVQSREGASASDLRAGPALSCAAHWVASLVSARRCSTPSLRRAQTAALPPRRGSTFRRSHPLCATAAFGSWLGVRDRATLQGGAAQPGVLLRFSLAALLAPTVFMGCPGAVNAAAPGLPSCGRVFAHPSACAPAFF